MRVVERRERSRLGVAATVLGTLGLLVFLVDDLLQAALLPAFGSRVVGQLVVGLAFALAAMGPWLRPRVHPRRARARVDEARGEVHLGRRRIPARRVSGVSVAPAERGFSVGLLLLGAFGGGTTFLEVEDRATAHAIARALGGAGPIAARALGGRLLAPQSRVGVVLVSVLIALTGALSIAGGMGMPWAEGLRGIGLAGALLAPAAIVYSAGRASRRWATNRATPWDAHVALHAAAAEASSGPAAEAPVREHGLAGVLARGEEPATAWLARLDALPRDASAYRGAALAREALLAVVQDEAATPDARAGAARLLALRHDETPRTLVRVVADPDVRLRVEAATEPDPEDAADELERLGPLFRAR